MTITTQPSTPCHLLSLPPELRNRIWRFVLVKASAIDVFAVSTATERGRIYKYAQVSHDYPHLLGVSRQIRDQAKAIYFEENIFQFDPSAGTRGCVQAFERWSGRSADRTKSVRAVKQSLENFVLPVGRSLRLWARW